MLKKQFAHAYRYTYTAVMSNVVIVGGAGEGRFQLDNLRRAVQANGRDSTSLHMIEALEEKIDTLAEEDLEPVLHAAIETTGARDGEIFTYNQAKKQPRRLASAAANGIILPHSIGNEAVSREIGAGAAAVLGCSGPEGGSPLDLGVGLFLSSIRYSRGVYGNPARFFKAMESVREFANHPIRSAGIALRVLNFSTERRMRDIQQMSEGKTAVGMLVAKGDLLFPPYILYPQGVDDMHYDARHGNHFSFAEKPQEFTIPGLQAFIETKDSQTFHEAA